MFNLAEAQRFELWNPFGSPVFKTEEIIIKINNINKNGLIFGIFYHQKNQAITYFLTPYFLTTFHVTT
ncbi:hypothetical protein EJM78_11555 [Salmonella enterica]|nr:hypothetical protein [Salmonella enterica]EAT2662066.1 hypothetical protein [Salmonella enterica]